MMIVDMGCRSTDKIILDFYNRNGYVHTKLSIPCRLDTTLQDLIIITYKFDMQIKKYIRYFVSQTFTTMLNPDMYMYIHA